MEPEQCSKLDDCPKIKMILDKDLLDFQYAEAVRGVCAKCSEVKSGGGDSSGTTYFPSG